MTTTSVTKSYRTVLTSTPELTARAWRARGKSVIMGNGNILYVECERTPGKGIPGWKL